MFVEHTPEQKALREELREYFSGLLTPEIRSRLVDLEGGAGQQLAILGDLLLAGPDRSARATPESGRAGS